MWIGRFPIFSYGMLVFLLSAASPVLAATSNDPEAARRLDRLAEQNSGAELADFISTDMLRSLDRELRHARNAATRDAPLTPGRQQEVERLWQDTVATYRQALTKEMLRADMRQAYAQILNDAQMVLVSDYLDTRDGKRLMSGDEVPEEIGTPAEATEMIVVFNGRLNEILTQRQLDAVADFSGKVERIVQSSDSDGRD